MSTDINAFEWAKDELNDKYSCFKLIPHERHVILPPRYTDNIKRGILDVLNTDLNTYSEKLLAVVVAYNNVRVLDSVASIQKDAPYLHFNVKLDLIVFKPVIGSVILGVANRISPSHVGCLIHGLFNASIPRPSDDKWFGDRVNLGDEFEFEITQLVPHTISLSVKGKFTENTTIIRNVFADHENYVGVGGNVSEDDECSDPGLNEDEADKYTGHKSKSKLQKIECMVTQDQRKSHGSISDHDHSSIDNSINIDESDFDEGVGTLGVDVTDKQITKKQKRKHTKTQEPAVENFSYTTDDLGGKKKRSKSNFMSANEDYISTVEYDQSPQPHEVVVRKKKKSKKDQRLKSEVLNNTDSVMSDNSMVGSDTNVRVEIKVEAPSPTKHKHSRLPSLQEDTSDMSWLTQQRYQNESPASSDSGYDLKETRNLGIINIKQEVLDDGYSSPSKAKKRKK